MNREAKALAKRAARKEKRETQARHHADAGARLRRRDALRKLALGTPLPIQEVLRAQMARFVTRFGRNPETGEPIFFDGRVPAVEGPKPIMSADEEELDAAAEAIGAPPDLVKMLVRSGVIARGPGSVSAQGG